LKFSGAHIAPRFQDVERTKAHRFPAAPQELFEEVVTFFLNRSDAAPQPEEGRDGRLTVSE